MCHVFVNGGELWEMNQNNGGKLWEMKQDKVLACIAESVLVEG